MEVAVKRPREDADCEGPSKIDAVSQFKINISGLTGEIGEMTPLQLRSIFQKFGQIKRIQAGSSTAEIWYENAEALSGAKSMDGQAVMGVTISVIVDEAGPSGTRQEPQSLSSPAAPVSGPTPPKEACVPTSMVPSTAWGARDGREPTLSKKDIEEDEKCFAGHVVGTGINFDKYDNIQVKVTEPVPPVNSFYHIKVDPSIQNNILRLGYSTPTPIQKYAIPCALHRRDLMACAQTGSGKTCAYLYPICHKMIEDGPPEIEDRKPMKAYPVAVVLAPTRELAKQIYEDARMLTSRTGIRIVVCYGGAGVREQANELMLGADILIATPGRLDDFANKGHVMFAATKHLAIDEADRMLDMGFIPQIRGIICGKDMPKERNTVMFSATFPKEIRQLASEFMTSYVFLQIGKVGSTNEFIKQKIMKVEDHDKEQMLTSTIRNIQGKVLIFVEMKRTATSMERYLTGQEFKATSIHGDKQQYERERALNSFKTGDKSILVATDVASRGLDIPDVSYVINYDCPKVIEDYVHRIGRTGRVGKGGNAITFYNNSSSKITPKLIKLLKECKQEVPSFLENGDSDFTSNSRSRKSSSNYSDW